MVQLVEGLAQHLSLCRRAFHEGLAEAAALNDAQTRLYRMDVGGAPFHTQTEVLHRHGGMLSAMVSDNFTHDVEGGGYVFLDRDPTWFPLVLHFMRTGIALLPQDAEGCAAVLREARYYSLEGPVRAAWSEERIILMGPSHCVMYNPLQESWERMVGDMGMGVLPNCCSFLAGDRCLFAIVRNEVSQPDPDTDDDDPDTESVFKLCPSTCSWELIASDISDQRYFWWWACDHDHLYRMCELGVQSIGVSTGQLHNLPRPSTERNRGVPCVVDGRLFIIGGGTACVEEYIPMQRRWVYVPDMPSAVSEPIAVAWEGKLLVIGGLITDEKYDEIPISAVLQYDPEDCRWTELPSLRNLTAQYDNCSVAVLGADVWVFGYWVERYNCQSQCWEAMPSPPVSSDAVLMLKVFDPEGASEPWSG